MNEAKQATPRQQLLDEILDSRIPKNEREHVACREIERLRALCRQMGEALEDLQVYPACLLNEGIESIGLPQARADFDAAKEALAAYKEEATK